MQNVIGSCRSDASRTVGMLVPLAATEPRLTWNRLLITSGFEGIVLDVKHLYIGHEFRSVR
jgi:hypothetical protein